VESDPPILEYTVHYLVHSTGTVQFTVLAHNAVHSPVHSLAYSTVHSPVHSLAYSAVHSPVHSLAYSTVHSPVQFSPPSMGTRLQVSLALLTACLVLQLSIYNMVIILAHVKFDSWLIYSGTSLQWTLWDQPFLGHFCCYIEVFLFQR